MSLEETIALAVRQAVHAALDERETHALPRLYTLKELETAYTDQVTGEKRLKASTLRALIKSGDLEAVKPGSEYLISPEALKVALERFKVPASAKAVEGVRISRT